MFQEEVLSEDLASHFGRENPAFYNAVRIQLQERFPVCKFSMYSYKTHSMAYWFGYMDMKLTKSKAIVCSEGPFDEADFLEGLAIFDETVDVTQSRREFLFTADQIYIDAIAKYMDSKDYGYGKYPTCNYFMTEEQEKKITEYELPALPEGYELGSATGDDAEIITKTWIHAAAGDEEQTRMKVTCLPSSCIRFHGEPVAFEMLDCNGILNHLFVMEEHRRKGLGTIVEYDHAQKCIREGIAVFKNVETFNVNVLAASDRSPFWSKATNEDGSPIFRVYLPIWPKESHKEDH